jgi:LacI family transcriptional regulator
VEPKRQYGLKEIAKELNVSRGTLDRVIHNRGGIGPETTARVLAYLKSIGYKPNKLGRSLARRQQMDIFVSFHDTKNEFFKDVLAGLKAAESEIADFGFKMRYEEVSRNSASQIKLIKEAMRSGAAGLALSPYEPDKFVGLVDGLVKGGKPVVTFNNDVVNSARMTHVGVNYYTNGRVAGEVLAKAVKSGAVGVIRRSSSYFQNQLRITGFSEVIDSYEDIRLAGSFSGSADYQTAYENIKRVIQSVPDLHGLLLLNNESEIITATCDAIGDSGRKPFDVVTFDLPSACQREIQNGRITATVCQDPFFQGYFCVKILFKFLSDNFIPPKSLYSTRQDVIFKENLDNYTKDLYRSFY